MDALVGFARSFCLTLGTTFVLGFFVEIAWFLLLPIVSVSPTLSLVWLDCVLDHFVVRIVEVYIAYLLSNVEGVHCL